MAEVGYDVEKAAHLLSNNEVVAIPTETVYGLAGNAFSEAAISKIFEVKNRPLTDPLIVHLPAVEAIEPLVLEFPTLAKRLFEAFSPGPLTILLPKSKLIPDLVTNFSPLAAFRIPNHRLTLKLLHALNFPLVAPSANLFGALSPSTACHVQKGIGHKISYILDGGPCAVGLESTIIKIENETEIKVLRQGGISEEELIAFAHLSQSDANVEEVVPGGMLSHYAPKKPLLLNLIEEALKQYGPEQIGYLAFDQLEPLLPEKNQYLLSVSGKIDEAARNLFYGLHFLDGLAIEIIVAAKIPEYGLGKSTR